MAAWKSIQPADLWTIAGDCVITNDGVVYLDNWRSAFSQPQHRTETLVSDTFWFCLWFAWQNQNWNYLWHIFPGRCALNEKKQIVDNEVKMILRYRDNIAQILASWRDDGLETKDLGIFGGRVWAEGGGKWYLEAVHILGALGKEVFWEEPRVIWLPTRGIVYGNSVPGEEPQTVFVWKEGILIHTESPALEHPIAIGEVSERVAQILS